MVMSDRIALLRLGQLEQIAAPREIYQRPATSYTAQFIGHTNLLRGDVKSGAVQCGSLSWKTSLPDGAAVFSLRPEMIRIVAGATNNDAVQFRGQIKRQAFHGATELLQVECSDGLTFSLRAASQPHWQGELQLEFSPIDAIPVRESSNVKENG